jgi:energy-coupling factor transport system ATP-binding protein
MRRWFQGAPEAPKGPALQPLLETEALSFRYSNGLKALEDVSLTVGSGEMMAIVGCNGAGKSTFAKLLCGFEKPSGGVIRFRGRDMAGDSVKKRADHIGYVMQNPNQMISHAMIRDEVASGLIARGMEAKEVARRVEEALTICGLHPFRSWPVSALSYGQKKRMTIASILALEPEILILDEPTAGQDFRNYTRIMEFLRQLNARGIAIVMITHDMHLMLEYCPRAAVFAGGRLIADDTGAGVLTSPETVRAASLKETSLYALSLLCGIPDARAFAQRFIDHDREVRA